MFLRRRIVRPLPVLALLLAPHPATAGGPITSGTSVLGSVTGPSYTESWTFSGVAGERVLIAAVTQSGINTQTTLRAPGGTAVISSAADRTDYQLLATGTYTIEISDVGLDQAGAYRIGFLNVTSGPFDDGVDLDGGALASAEQESGTTTVGDFDLFTVTGNAGDRVLFAAIGASINTSIAMYPPGGGAAVYFSNGGDRLDLSLAATGTYRVVVEDLGNDQNGSYVVSHLNLDGTLTSGSDPDGGAIASATEASGTIGTQGDFDAFTFSGTLNDRVVFAAVSTSGAPFNTTMYLYPPEGAPVIVSLADRAEYQLNATGTWTLLIEDLAQDQTGTYTVGLLNVTSGPRETVGDPDGGGIVTATHDTGSIGGVADFDAFTFEGTAGHRVLFSALATGGASFNTVITLYPPGGAAAVYQSSGGDRLDHTLTATGTYVAVIEDVGNDHAGTYAVSYLDLHGVVVSIPDPDGGAIASGQVVTGTTNALGDFDAFGFPGVMGQRVVFTAVATTGAPYNTLVSLYPPDGGPVLSATSDRGEFQLTMSGSWTIVVEDLSLDHTGTYTLGFLNITGGPHTTGSDPDGGAIASNAHATGQMHSIADFDAFTFDGVAGHRVLFSAIGTGGPLNTVISLYPPGGGAPVYQSAGGDRLDHALAASGTYTVVIEDVSQDDVGTYAVSFLDLQGTLTNGTDEDGGFLSSNEVRIGTTHLIGDFDAYTLVANAGQRVVIAAVSSSGAPYNTQTTLYPPNGAPTVSSVGDRNEFQINATGTWTIVIEDQGLDHLGTYTVSFVNLQGALTFGADTDGGAVASADRRSGQIHSIADFDGFTISGGGGDRVVISAIQTGGAGMNTTLSLYPPDGGPAEFSTSGGFRIDHKLQKTGTYTVLVEDVGNDHTGSYGFTWLNLSAGPFTHASDLDGGVIADGDVRNASSSPIPDMDAWQFGGAWNDEVTISAVTTSGALNTTMYLYPPDGGAPAVVTLADNLQFTLTQSGTWVVLVQDVVLNAAGDYALTFNKTGAVLDADGGPLDPLHTVLLPAQPMPFRDRTVITWSLPRDARARIVVYDVRGARVHVLADGVRPAGVHRAEWDGRDGHGAVVPAGMYFARLDVDGEVLTQRLVRVQ